MSKKLVNGKEIEKARIERKWKNVITLVSALNVKNAGGALTSEEVELYSCFYLGEAELEHAIEQCDRTSGAFNIRIPEDKLRQAYSYLCAAATASKKAKDRHPHIYQDSHLLLSKYYCVVGHHQTCVQTINSVELLNIDTLSKRGKYILAEALTCKALALEVILKAESRTAKEIISTYEMATDIVLNICIEEDKPATLKRTATPTSTYANVLTPMLETCLTRPAELFIINGEVNKAIESYRLLLKAVETKTMSSIRKVICRRLAEVLLSSVDASTYSPPGMPDEYAMSRTGSISISTPTKTDTLNTSTSNKSLKRDQTNNEDSVFIPMGEVEESVLLLLLGEAMHTKHAVVKQHKEDSASKRKILNETNVIFDLLVLALARCEQYSLAAQSLEKIMHLAFDEFHLWYQFGLSLMCSAKYSQALLIFDQCLKISADNTDVLMLCVKLCINHLHKFQDAISYASKVLHSSTDVHEKASAFLSIGICNNHLAIKAKFSSENQKYLQLSLNALNQAYELDKNDTEILFNLALTQALSKQLSPAIITIRSSLAIDPTSLSCMYLLILLLSAEKKYHEALDVLETAVEEYPEEFNLQIIKVKLTEECHGSQAAVVVCQNLLLLWNEKFNISTRLTDHIDNAPLDITKSPSYSMSLTKQSLNESKAHDTTASLKKVSLADGTSVYDEDGTTSITASGRFEYALSEGTSGAIAMYGNIPISSAIALLSRFWLLTAECFIHLGDATEASGCILEASSIFPLSPDVLYMRGRLNELQENSVEAKACYESAMALLPTHTAASQRLALLYHDNGNLVLAEQTLRGCILQDASNHTAWNDLGVVLESADRNDEAVECFMSSLHLEMSSPVLPYTIIPRFFKAFDAT
ncbi:tetratricopeptide repeat protein 7B-like [Hydractinia symbiolongicarpus]|uniref:tetratricopeptide repeat protein 7B-like n=1 Tax=Hydractinia symbiolongicarpus TaxID=13093 RepID=UPI002549D04C|nr:tetratricopeptide repeat protein 7B-like [Hydractinia symbiolongicarpus]